ncbi:hypothetical protein HDZ31DRAFT_66627 [Schizophyllum fasciatum]
MRHVFMIALGQPMNRPLNSITPQYAPTSGIEGGAWVLKPQEGVAGVPARILEPDWHKRWSDNSEWHNELVRFVRVKISEIQPLMNAEFMASKSDADLLTKLAATFKTIKAHWNAAEIATPAIIPTPGSTIPTVVAAALGAQPPDVKAKHVQRKTRKAQKRLEALRSCYDAATVAEWSWVVDGHHYMSSDESGDEDVGVVAIDPASDDDTKGRKAKAVGKKGPWIARPPKYRSAELQKFLDNLDEEVSGKANELNTLGRGRVKGESKEVDLPRLPPKKNMKRIPRLAVDPVWLAAHPEAVALLRREGDAVATHELEVATSSHIF